MVRRALIRPLLGLAALLLAACGGAVEVAVEEPSAPESAAPAEPSAVPEPTPWVSAAPSPAGDEDRRPAGSPSPGPGAETTGGDPSPSPAAPALEPAASAGSGPAEGDEVPAGEAGDGGPGSSTDEDTRAIDGPAIAIARPAAGSEHGRGPVTASGQATVYEGTVLLTLIGPDGSVVEEAFTTATAGAPERGRWSHTFTEVADVPGRWRIVAAATDPSGGEGRAPARTETAFDVTGGR